MMVGWVHKGLVDNAISYIVMLKIVLFFYCNTPSVVKADKVPL